MLGFIKLNKIIYELKYKTIYKWKGYAIYFK